MPAIKLARIDNLALIPGTVGASPVQNIGAYGQEVAECIEAVEGIDLLAAKQLRLTNQACQFNYRNSIFKHSLKKHFFITAVEFRFSKVAKPNLSYAPLARFFEGKDADFKAVRDAIKLKRKTACSQFIAECR